MLALPLIVAQVDPAAVVPYSAQDLFTAVAILGVCAGGALGLVWLGLQVYGRMSEPGKRHQQEHERLMRVVLGREGGGEAPGLLERTEALERMADASHDTLAEVREIKALLTSKVPGGSDAAG